MHALSLHVSTCQDPISQPRTSPRLQVLPLNGPDLVLGRGMGLGTAGPEFDGEAPSYQETNTVFESHSVGFTMLPSDL